MAMPTHNAGDDWDDEQLAREAEQGVTDLEVYLAAYAAPPLPPEAPELDGEDLAAELREVDEMLGETDRVRQLEAEVAEGKRLRALYAEQYDLDLDTPKVRRRRVAGQEAAKLHMLGRIPAVLALQAAKVLRVINAAAFTALFLALGWSTVGVHGFAAAGAPLWSAEWIVGWFVEPFLSLALLAIVGAKAYLATRGHLVNSPTLEKIEWTFLGLTLGMNVYPTIPGWVGPAERFVVSDLVLHSLGPVVAVSIVRGLPVLWAEFGKLDHGLPTVGLPGTPTVGITATEINNSSSTGHLYSQNTESGTPKLTDHVLELTAKAVRLIRSGQLSRDAGVHAFRKALGCGTDRARAVRNAIQQNGAGR